MHTAHKYLHGNVAYAVHHSQFSSSSISSPTIHNMQPQENHHHDAIHNLIFCFIFFFILFFLFKLFPLCYVHVCVYLLLLSVKSALYLHCDVYNNVFRWYATYIGSFPMPFILHPSGQCYYYTPHRMWTNQIWEAEGLWMILFMPVWLSELFAENYAETKENLVSGYSQRII